ncbi:MAG: IS4 family transposase [Verrucomicrobia bacterium]|nr:IS4 family transposase [Verrucomicrobiota bacterium]
MNNTTPARSNVIVLKQLLNHIPLGLINRVARETGVADKARTFSVLSHLTAMLFAQLSHAISLNDVCDWLRLKAAAIARFGATPPSRNNLSHANKERDAQCAEQLFWSVLAHLQHASPSFVAGRKGKGLLRRFRVRIHAVDSTTIQLVANCMDWAKHRRRKAAAKMHLRLDLHTFLPSFAIVDTAREHDNKRAREVCAGLQPGEIVVFDKAYVEFAHLFDLGLRGVWWVTRAKDNMKFRVVKNHTKGHENIIRDQLVALKGQDGMVVRRVEAWVEVDDEWRKMVFITNNLAWSPRSVCDLYRRRWDIEVFFKQVKQTLKLGSFLGHSANAVRWQIYTALLVYVLLRFMAHLAEWGHSFTRLFAVVRSALWERIDLLALLKSYGTASGRFKVVGALNQAWLPGFAHSNT